jgi:hypothetical protein
LISRLLGALSPQPTFAEALLVVGTTVIYRFRDMTAKGMPRFARFSFRGNAPLASTRVKFHLYFNGNRR